MEINRDYYKILHLGPHATADQVHHAYRTLAMRYHPDRNPGPEAEATMAAINEAYAVLSDPSRRSAYDRGRFRPDCVDVTAPVLAAAKAILLKQGWTVLNEDRMDLVLERRPLRTLVRFVPELSTSELGDWLDASARAFKGRSIGLSAALAVRVRVPEKISAALTAVAGPAVVIDLVRSERFGSPYPDPRYKALFEPFGVD